MRKDEEEPEVNDDDKKDMEQKSSFDILPQVKGTINDHGTKLSHDHG